MDFRSLRIFLAVAQEKSFVRAAEAIYLTQPNLTRTIKELENELGEPLFIRSKKGLILTEKGLLLQRRAEEIISLVRKTKEDLMKSEEEVVGTVYLASGETDGIRPIARAMKFIRGEYPGIRFHIFSGHGPEVVRKIDNGTADFGIVFEPFDLKKYDHLRMPWSETWGVLARKDDPIASLKVVTREDLKKCSLWCSEQMSEGNGLSGWLGERVDNLNIIGTYTLINTPKIMVEEGVGTALTFENLVNTDSEDSDLVFRPLYPPLHAGMYLIWKKDQLFSKPASIFLERLRAFS